LSEMLLIDGCSYHLSLIVFISSEENISPEFSKVRKETLEGCNSAEIYQIGY
jgi:hypothetical protein